CISDTLVPTTYLVDTTLSDASDYDQTVHAVRLRSYRGATGLINSKNSLNSPVTGRMSEIFNPAGKKSVLQNAGIITETIQLMIIHRHAHGICM
ncbi:hypothetical protein, partial [Klebsiella michiganensis]